jgi:hypothetical protein
MPYTNVDIFREKGLKVWEPLNFMKKLVKKKIIVDLFAVISLTSFYITNGFHRPGENRYGFLKGYFPMYEPL